MNENETTECGGKSYDEIINGLMNACENLKNRCKETNNPKPHVMPKAFLDLYEKQFPEKVCRKNGKLFVDGSEFKEVGKL